MGVSGDAFGCLVEDLEFSVIVEPDHNDVGGLDEVFRIVARRLRFSFGELALPNFLEQPLVLGLEARPGIDEVANGVVQRPEQQEDTPDQGKPSQLAAHHGVVAHDHPVFQSSDIFRHVQNDGHSDTNRGEHKGVPHQHFPRHRPDQEHSGNVQY
jgi:hypothetical protein